MKSHGFEALAAMDMDGTLLELRSIDVLCREFGLQNELREIDRKSKTMKGYEVTEAIAKLFAGRKASDMESIFDGIPVVKGAGNFIKFLKEKNFYTVIVTDSYTFLASRLAEKLGVDAVAGNTLEIVDGIVTGKIAMPLGWEKEKCLEKSVCKLHTLRRIAAEQKIPICRTLAIGDSVGDYCMIEEAAVGVAFRPKDPRLLEVANLVAYGDFYELRDKLKVFLSKIW